MTPKGATGLNASATSRSSLSVFKHVRWEHLLAGVSGGVASTLVLHPLDLIKIRFQVNEGVAITSRPQYNGVIHAFSTIARTEGLRGLYQGVTPNVWGAGASWGLYFLFYNTAKAWMLERNPGSVVLETSQHMTAAAEAGILTLMVTNPLWVAKTRLCLQYENLGQASTTNAVQYKGTLDCLIKIAKYEGIKGLYKGLIPGIVGVSHGVVQFVSYEELKKLYNNYRQVPLDTKFSTLEYITFAAISKIIAASSTYPYQVVRSRLQDQHRSYTGLWDVIAQTWRQEQLRGFFKGLSPYLLHVTPNICIVFLMYEKCMQIVAERIKREEMMNSESGRFQEPARSFHADPMAYEEEDVIVRIDLKRTVNIADMSVCPVSVKIETSEYENEGDEQENWVDNERS